MPAHGNYKTAAVVAATKIPIETFYRWLDRRVIPLSRDDVPGNGRGKPRRFCVRTVTKLAIAHKISQLGIPANIAVTLASKFTDEPQNGRPIGSVFPVGSPLILMALLLVTSTLAISGASPLIPTTRRRLYRRPHT